MKVKATLVADSRDREHADTLENVKQFHVDSVTDEVIIVFEDNTEALYEAVLDAWAE